MNKENRLLKSSLIPSDWKERIDEILTIESLGANRYFAATNPQLSRKIKIQSLKNPTDFFNELYERWEWHHSFFEDLVEPAINQLSNKNVFDITPEQISTMSTIYRAISKVDQATLIPTAATKTHIEFWVNLLKNKMYLSDEEVITLLTPPRLAFWTEYLYDNLKYFVKDSGEAKEMEKASLLEKYHANDELIMSGRIKKLASFTNSSKKKLKIKLKKLSVLKKNWYSHFYFCLGREYCDSLGKTIAFDNFDEYLLLTTFVGISGFVFRKDVLRMLNETKILPNTGAIYQFDDVAILDGLKKLSDYREKVMIRNVHLFPQGTQDSCACACLVMVLDYFSLAKANRTLENEIYSSACAESIPGTHMSGLMKKASSYGLETLLVHSSSDLFSNEQTFFENSLFETLMVTYRDFLKNLNQNEQVLKGVNISSEYLLGLIKKGYLIILAGGKGIFHAVLLVGYDQDGFVVLDPLSNKRQHWSKERVISFSKTVIGSWCLALKKDDRNVQRLLDEIPRFTHQAETYLSI